MIHTTRIESGHNSRAYWWSRSICSSSSFTCLHHYGYAHSGSNSSDAVIHTTKGPTIYGTGYWYREVSRQNEFAGVAGNAQIYDLPSHGTVFAVILQELRVDFISG